MREARWTSAGWPARLALLAVALGGASGSAKAATSTDPGPWHAEPARYGVSSATQFMVPMSDGVHLAVDVYRPTTATGRPVPGRFPVILSQTPYGKRSLVTTQSMGSGMGGDGFYPYLVQRGYIDVVADIRGAGSSDGDFSLFGAREMQDGVELARWAARLPGSTGAVGMAGSSYVGLNQLFTAALIGPHSPVRAIVPSTVGSDIYRDLAFGGGIPDLEFAGVWEGLRSTMTTAPPDQPTGNPQAAANHLPARSDRLAEFDGQLYAEVDTGGPRAYDNAFWSVRAPSQYLDRVVRNGIPALIVSGWHDVYQRGAVLDYAGLQNAYSRLHGGPGRTAASVPPMTAAQTPTGRYQLVAGPWFHNPTTLGLRFQQIQLAWFDRWLKGIRTGIDASRTPLHVFELGQERWLDVARWPLTQTRPQTLYLGAGTLDATPHKASGSTDRLLWSDARSPCNPGTDQWSTGLPAIAIADGGGRGDPCADDDRSTQAGGLTYTSQPFKTATTIAGPIDVSLLLSSTRPDAEVVASVDVVSPSGGSFPISSGALLGSMRAIDSGRSWRIGGRTVLPWHPYTRSSARPLRPGVPARLELEVYPTVARVPAGSRVRLTLTSGDTALQPSPVQIQSLAGGVYSVARGASWITLLSAPANALRTSPVSWGGCNGSC